MWSETFMSAEKTTVFTRTKKARSLPGSTQTEWCQSAAYMEMEDVSYFLNVRASMHARTSRLGEVDLVTAWTRYSGCYLKSSASCMLYVGKLAAVNVLECILLRWTEYLKSCITGFVGLKLIMLARGFRYITPPSWEIELEWHDTLPQLWLSRRFIRSHYLQYSIIMHDTKTHFLKTNFLLRNKKKFYTLVKPV